MSLETFLTAGAPVAGAVLFLLNMVYGRMDRHLEVLQKMANEPAGTSSLKALVEELRLRAFREVFFPEPMNLQGLFAFMLVVSGVFTLLLSLLVLPDHEGETYRLFYLFVGLGTLYFTAGVLAIRPKYKQPKGENDLIRQWLKDEQARMRTVHRHEWEKSKQETLDNIGLDR